MKKVIFIYLLIISSLAMMGCSQRESLEREQGTLSVRVPNIVVSEFTKTAPTVEQLTIEVRDENRSYYNGPMPLSALRLPAGSYTVSASYGTAVELDFDSPHYYAQQADVSVVAKQSTTVELNVKLFNAIVEPVFDAALVAQFGDDLAVEISNGAVSQIIKPGEPRLLYARAGQTLAVTLRGTNLLGTAVEKQLSDIHTLSATHHKVNCNAELPQFTMPAPQGYDVWANKLYVRELSTGDVARGNAANILPNLIYEYSTDQITWLPFAEKENGMLKIAGLTPAYTYYLRAKFKDITSTNTVMVVTETAEQIVNAGFEDWSRVEICGNQGAAWAEAIYCDYPGAASNNTVWESRNQRTTRGAPNGTTVYWRWCSGTVETSDKTQGSRAAEVSTMGFYNLKVGSGVWYRDQLMNYKPSERTVWNGYLFTGTFNKDNDTYDLGTPHNSRPYSISFDFKYSSFPAGQDNCLAYAVLYDASKNEIARTADFKSTDQQQYVTQTLAFTYTNTKIKAAYVGVFFRSGFRTTVADIRRVDGDRNGSPFAKDRLMGSTLKVDNVVLNYTE